MKLTEPQRKVMMGVMRDHSGEIYASKRSLSVLALLHVRCLLHWDNARKCGRKITPAGWEALRVANHARWAKHGCMAYLDDLKEVELAKSRSTQ